MCRVRAANELASTLMHPNSSRLCIPASRAKPRTPTPPPPPSHILSTTSASQHKLFSPRSSTRLRTNSRSSPSPSHHTAPLPLFTDHVSSRPFRMSTCSKSSASHMAIAYYPSSCSTLPTTCFIPLTHFGIQTSCECSPNLTYAILFPAPARLLFLVE
jgi:hypothetical protein